MYTNFAELTDVPRRLGFRCQATHGDPLTDGLSEAHLLKMIPRRIFTVPRRGFYNFHHSDTTWLSYPGPDPIGAMLLDGKTHVVITMHEVSEVLDGGRFIAHSPPVPLPPDANGAIVHRMTWPRMGGWIREQVLRLVQPAALPVH